MAQSFFEVLSEPFEDEEYLPDEERRPKSKTVPKNGGRTPETFDVWETFEEEVAQFIRDHRIQLQANSVPLKHTPRKLGMEISNEAEVRSAIHMDCIHMVELAMRSCLHKLYTIRSADDRFVKGNMDYAGFLLNPDTGRPESVVLPIEIKGPWELDVQGWETLPGLMNGGEEDSSRVRNAVSQLFMYMVISETQHGVLCSKSKYFFFRRSGNPQEKHLEVSRTICNDSTSPSVRQCWLYISHLAVGAELFPCQWIETTPPEHKWVKIPQALRSGSIRAQGRGGVSKSVTRSSGAYGRSSSDPSASSSSDVPLDDGNWFLSLPDVSLHSLELGKIIQKTYSSTIYAHKSNPNLVIKIYEFCETFETLNHFKREIDAYIRVADLHGLLVPRIFGYGASWGHFLGFITMEALGPSIDEGDLDKSFSKELLDGLHLLHVRKVYHGDLNLRNILHLVNNERSDEGSSEPESSFNFRFVDFGDSVYPCDETGLEQEREEFQNFLNDYI